MIALNRPVDGALRRALSEQFIEVLLAPGFDADALELLQAKKNVRLLELADWPRARRRARSQAGDRRPARADPRRGLRDARADERRDRARAERGEWRDLLFAWTVCRHVRSNAIVLARAGATIGIGAGQMSRVDAVRIAVEKAAGFQPDLLAGSALASDAFFPFADGPQLAIDAGVTRDHPARRLGPRRGGHRRRRRGGIAMVATGGATSATERRRAATRR